MQWQVFFLVVSQLKNNSLWFGHVARFTCDFTCETTNPCVLPSFRANAESVYWIDVLNTCIDCFVVCDYIIILSDDISSAWNEPERIGTVFRFVILAFAPVPVDLNYNLRVPDCKNIENREYCHFSDSITFYVVKMNNIYIIKNKMSWFLCTAVSVLLSVSVYTQ